MVYSTPVIPFQVQFKPGRSPFREAVYAVKKALVCGQLRPGQQFPSVRTLSQELKINPNTAHKVVAELVRDGVLEVRPGIGTVVREDSLPSAAQDVSELDEPLEQLVVKARRLGLSLETVQQGLAEHWQEMVPAAAAANE